VNGFLEDLGRRRFRKLLAVLAFPSNRCKGQPNFISTLDPKPGQIFSPDPNSYVLPDVSVDKVDDGYSVTLNGDQIPHLRISKTYKDLMTQEAMGGRARLHPREDQKRKIP